MKMLLFLLILLGTVVGASMYIKQNPIKLNLSLTQPLKPNNNVSVTPQISASASPISCSRTPIVDVTEGPYYKQGSPERNTISDATITGTSILLSGLVLDENCNPIANAWLDFWQADAGGNYDNQGFKLRGHQYTDTSGRYIVSTVIPGEYPGRTPHIHVKVRPFENGPVTTTQLFIPNAEKNTSDTLYDDSLLVSISDGPEGKTATYNFVIRTR